MGARGFSTAGLNLGNPVGGVPMSALASLGKLLLGEGGASGDDAEGGLLDRRLGIFVNGAIRWGDKDATERESGFDFESQGCDDRRRLSVHATGSSPGLAVGYATGDADFDNDGGGQDSDGYSGTLYGTWYGERGYFDAIASYGQVSYDSIRNINIASLGISDRAIGDTDADQCALGLGTGYDFGKGALRFGPTLSLNYVKIDVDGFTETTDGTSGLAMRFDDQSADSLTAKLGAQLAYNLSRKWGILTPQARFEFVREFKNDSQQVTVQFANDAVRRYPGQAGSGFVVFTDDPDERLLQLGGRILGDVRQRLLGLRRLRVDREPRHDHDAGGQRRAALPNEVPVAKNTHLQLLGYRRADMINFLSKADAEAAFGDARAENTRPSFALNLQQLATSTKSGVVQGQPDRESHHQARRGSRCGHQLHWNERGLSVLR